MVTLLLAVLGAAVLAAFVLAPLVKSEEDLKPFRRRRPGTRHLHGLDSVEVDPTVPDQRQCPHCGASVETEFDFCGQCSNPVP